MKIINTANGKILSEVITNHRMSIEEAQFIKSKPQGKRPGAFLYPTNASRLYIFEVEMFYRYNN